VITGDPCRPMPGPPGAYWPTAKPGTDYCGPYPSCCPHAVTSHSWGPLYWPSWFPSHTTALIILAAWCASGALWILFGPRRWRKRREAMH
jgi:hypothetical protein